MDVNLAIIVGFLTVVFGIIVKVVGFPAQMKTNYQRKSTKGLSTTFMALSFVTYFLWTLHGILQKDPVVYVGQGIGIITTGIILYQIWIYKNKK